MLTEEKLLSALKNFTLQELFTAAGQELDPAITSEDELANSSFHSAKEPKMVLTADPYQPPKAHCQSVPENTILSNSKSELTENLEDLNLQRQVNLQLQQKLDSQTMILKAQHNFIENLQKANQSLKQKIRQHEENLQ